MSGYRAKVFYQRDVHVLEKYGDEEAELYNQTKPEPSQYKGN